jgi:hypothetical protein
MKGEHMGDKISRRDFVKVAAITPIFFKTISFLPETQVGDALPVKFFYPDIIHYDHQCFTIHGHDLYLFSSCFHYFRCARPLWADRLDKIKGSGFNAVETYVAWNWHQQEPPGTPRGKADMEPLDAFLTECANRGLYVIVRPGPYICAEWNGGGLPSWLAHHHIQYRTDSPANEKWSSYWYDTVLPVVRKHLITHGGNVILVQLENEYDFSGQPKTVMANYIKSLYKDAKRNNIDVPLITCWTSVARDKSDPIMSQILDACNFYPGWNIDSTLGSIEAMLSQEPNSPGMVTELQGGWFSSVGGGSLRDTANYGPDQINALTKYVMAHGVAASSYYMGYGGTNFGYWGSPGRTTSYDYTAPIAEPGGLWDKTRAVKLIGDFVRIAGPLFVRSKPVDGGVTVTDTGVESLLRQNGKTGFLFLRNLQEQPRTITCQVTLNGQAPISLSVPMSERDARFLAFNLPMAGTTMELSNLEIAEAVRMADTPIVVAYGDVGDNATLSFNGTAVNGVIGETDVIQSSNDMITALVSRERAGKTRAFEVDGQPVVIISDSYFMRDIRPEPQKSGNLILDVETLPGENNFVLLTPRSVKTLRINGEAIELKKQSLNNVDVSRFLHHAPDFPFETVDIHEVRIRRDFQAPAVHMSDVTIDKDGGYNSLDRMGHYAFGYTVYKGELSPISKQGDLEFVFYDSDWHATYIDGKWIRELSGTSATQTVSPEQIGLDPSGTHSIEILYENEGRPNGGYMEQEKGINSIRISTGQNQIQGWKLSPKRAGALGENPPEAQPDYDDNDWTPIEVGHGTQPFFNGGNVNGWFRVHLNITQQQYENKSLHLRFGGVDDNGVVFVNGHKVVSHQGWNMPFNAPLHPYVKPGDNVIAVYVQNIDGPGGIWRPVELLGNGSEDHLAKMTFHPKLAGEIAGWHTPHFDDSEWSSRKVEEVSGPDEITWCRAQFHLPDTKGWDVRWSLEMQAACNAQIWVNGVLVGRFFPEGPQTRFYLPSCWLKVGEEPNSLVIVMRPSKDGTTPPSIASLKVSAYTEYSPKVDRMEIEI